MVATTDAIPRLAPCNITGGELVLRVSGSSREGQVVRLRSAKCTIGSGRNCTLRLRARGVAPLHCLVLRGPAATVVRRWSADTRLNRQSFSDAPLAVGDRLGVGPIELEVLEAGAPPTREAVCQSAQETQSRLATCSTNRLATESSEPVDQSWRQRQAEQEEAQHRLDEQGEHLAAQSAQLDAQRRELAAERASFESAQNDWAQQRTHWQTEQDALARQRVEIQAEQEALAQQRRQWLTQQQEVQRQLEQRREQLAAEAAKLESQRGEIEAGQNALAQQRSALEDERREWESRQTGSVAPEPPQEPPQEVEFQPPSEKAPVDLADVFRRVGASVEMPADGPTAGARPATAVAGGERLPSPPRPQSGGVSPEQTSPAQPNSHGEEESVDAYMSRLMQRIRTTGDSRETSSRTPHSSEPASAAGQTSGAAPAAESLSPLCPLPAPQRREPASVMPRAAAPERTVDLSAMRELANFSAHSALSRHARRTLLSTMHSKLIVVVVALAACGGLSWMWMRSTPGDVTFYAALLALLVAVYWGVHYALLTARLILEKSGHAARIAPATRQPAPCRETPPAGQNDQLASDQPAGG